MASRVTATMHVLRINPETAECSFIGGDLGTMEDKYQGGFLAHDGCIYCIPENAEHVMRIHPPGSTAYRSLNLKAHNAAETQVPLTKSQRKKFLNRRNRERSGSSKIGSVVKKNRSCCGPSPRVCPESRPAVFKRQNVRKNMTQQYYYLSLELLTNHIARKESSRVVLYAPKQRLSRRGIDRHRFVGRCVAL